MESLQRVIGIAVPMLRDNIDTDQIVPTPEMTRSTEETHERWGASLFANWRYVRDREPNPDFILNKEPWRHATILLGGANFGCGSSREPAPKALRGYGFRAIIAPSYSGIFHNNCYRNGILPVELPMEAIRLIAAQVEKSGGTGVVTVDLEKQEVMAPQGDVFAFKAPPALRAMLLSGLDEIDQTLLRKAEIAAFQAKDSSKRPWVYVPGLGG